ncbi:MAG: M3 family metallopeptidase [Gemmatimonadota bacterium]|nr:M3 family metallopeptidase [Gemmatimonadota bacterium]MDH3422936.1 M3 family metallopeptidase [Gemmatimonadota bacterium]
MTEINPILVGDFRIPFHKIKASHVQPGVEQALTEAQASIDALSDDPGGPTWDNTIGALDETVERLAERIAPVTHLMSVAETPQLREAYNVVLPAITTFWSRLPLNEALWHRVKAYAQTSEAEALEGIHRRHLTKTVRDFERAGADLSPEAKARLQDVRVELAQLQQTFSENVLDETAAFELLVTDEKRLAGVPEAAKKRARNRAKQLKKKGWVLTLDYPSVEPILKYCRDRELRREIHVAYATRCRDGKYDNRAILARILRLRDECAEILGYPDFPDYTLEDRMVGSGARAVAFEADLVARTRPFWERDVAELREHASTLGMTDLEPWDIAYLIDDLRRTRYDLDDEDLRPYFPLSHVLDGLFEVVRRTFGFRIEEREIQEVWHEDVRYYEIFDEGDGAMLGGFYTDWFPRVEKREGAWMNNFITGGPRPEGFAPHLGVICGNFTPPDGDRPALLTHREVQTIFHEFGHLLHHCTSRVGISARAGINVAWDWVELPSQLMENWTWEREALDLFSRHHETGDALPDDLVERMIAARRYMGGWSQMRQLSLGTVDLALHGELAPKLREAGNGRDEKELDSVQGDEVMSFGEERFAQFAPDPRFARLHMLTSFNHLFAGGYAAAYYSYLWSEVLDADVFTRFRREGIFNRETGRAYVEGILSRGDSADPDDLFVEFMGRAPDPEALLVRNLGPIGN